MFKKILAVLISAVLLSSCALTEAVNKKIDKAKEKAKEVKKEASEKIEDDLTLDELKQAKELGQNVLTAIQNDDVDTLADMFCQYTVDEYGDDLKPEIKKLYDFIDGDIIYNDDIQPSAGLAKSTREDGAVIYTYEALIENVITDTGKNYTIDCRGYIIYKDHPELEGFVKLYIDDMEEHEYVYEKYELPDIDESMFSYHVGNLPEEDLV